MLDDKPSECSLSVSPNTASIVRMIEKNLGKDCDGVIRDALEALAQSSDKALRFDLDRAGIERREADAIELVELRATVNSLIYGVTRLLERADATDPRRSSEDGEVK